MTHQLWFCAWFSFVCCDERNVMEHEEEKLFTLEEFLECLEVEEFSLRNCWRSRMLVPCSPWSRENTTTLRSSWIGIKDVFCIAFKQQRDNITCAAFLERERVSTITKCRRKLLRWWIWGNTKELIQFHSS